MNIINKIISRLPFFRNRNSRLSSNSNENKNFIVKNKYGTLRTLTDEEYRRVLKARIIKNSSDSSRNSFLELLNILSNNKSSVVTEGLDNTAISVEVEDYDGLVSYYLSKYKNDRNLIPVPLGRRLNVSYV